MQFLYSKKDLYLHNFEFLFILPSNSLKAKPNSIGNDSCDAEV